MTRALKRSFLRVLAAVAWADGEVTAAERNRIKVLFNGFDLDRADRRDIESLLERPVPLEEALELAKEFAGRLTPPGARRELLDEIEAMLGDETDRSPGERELLDHVRSILSSHTVVDGIAERLRGLFGRTLLARDRAGDDDGTGEGPPFARFLGPLLAAVLPAGSRDAAGTALAARDELDPEARARILADFDATADRPLDRQRVCADACRVTDMPGRIALLETLFAAAVADGRGSKEEIEEVRRIADLLWISLPEYLAVRDRYRDRIEP